MAPIKNQLEWRPNIYWGNSEQNGDDFVKIETNFIFLLDTISTWDTSLEVRILMKAGNVKTTYLRSLDICQDQQLTIDIQKKSKHNLCDLYVWVDLDNNIFRLGRFILLLKTVYYFYFVQIVVYDCGAWWDLCWQ